MSEANFFRNAAERFDAGDMTGAVEIAELGLRYHPEDASLWQILGCSHWGNAQPAEAVKALETASLYACLGPLARLSLLESYLHLENGEGAKTELLFLAPRNRCPLPLLPRLASAAGRMGEFRVAHSVCVRIAELRPQHHPAWFGIAYYAMRLGKPVQKAIEALKTAFQLAPTALTYRTNLASLFVQQGNIREAYDLISDVPVEAIECPRMLRGLLPAIEASGNESLARSYRRRLSN